MNNWKPSRKRRGRPRKGAIVQLGRVPEASNAKLRILYAGYSKTLRPKVLKESDWTTAMIAKVTGSIRSFWDRRIGYAKADGGPVFENPIGQEPADAVLPSAPVVSLFQQLDGAETVVLFGHVKVERAKETAAVIGTSICLFENTKRRQWMTPDEVAIVLPMTVKSVYVLGCRSDPFAERLAGKRPGLRVFGVAADNRVYESALDLQTPTTYDIFLYPETTTKGHELQNRKEVDFSEHVASTASGLAL